MKWRIAINGYGRIGQSILRALYQSPLRNGLEIVAINELADIETIAYLTKYDSTHGRFPLPVAVESDNVLMVDGDRISVSNHENIADLPWAEHAIDVVFECTGEFSEREDGQGHIDAGAKRVIFSQPAEANVDQTIVFGVNEGLLSDKDVIISNASCTTNAVVPVLKVLNDTFGISCGSMTTIHSAMNDQPIIDAYHHKDLRRTRSAMCNMVPVETELAKGVERILPELGGVLTAVAMRIPTVNVSAIDLTVQVKTSVSAEQVNAVLAQASEYSEIMAYTEAPLASSDFIQDPASCTIDGSQTRVSGTALIKVLIWFDNEWGFANRMLDVANHWQRVIDKS